MKVQHIPEDQLTEFLMGVSTRPERVQVHIAECEDCLQTLDSIRELQVSLQQEELPEPDLDANWVRLFSHISAGRIPGKKPRIQWQHWLAMSVPVCVLVLLLVLAPRVHKDRANRASSLNTDTTQHSHDLPDVAGQLAGIEQILVLVRHTDGPLDSSVRSEAVSLLGKNSSCIQAATSRNELGAARVLEDSGYLLTAITHSTGTSSEQALRNTELDLDTTLLQVRMLLQNGAGASDGGTT